MKEGKCIMGEMRKDREDTPEMKRLKAEVKALKQQLHLEFEKK